MVQPGQKTNMLKYLSWALLVLLVACTSEPNNTTETPKTTSVEKKNVTVPRFNRDSAYTFVEKQVSFGPRAPKTQAHTDCKNWMVGKLEAFGADVIVQEFPATLANGTELTGYNVIGQYNIDHPRRILLAAHWDTRAVADQDSERTNEPILGADDGGSGVGVLLEIARIIQENPIDLGIDIVFFDLEDQGKDGEYTWCLGSQHWAKNLHRPNYKPEYGILLDMVGSENARFPKEGYSVANANRILNKVWPLAQRMGYGNFFVDNRVHPVTDDHKMVMEFAKIPMIDIINLPADTETRFGHYWHTHDDNMSVIDKKTLRAVGQVVTAVIYQESGHNL